MKDCLTEWFDAPLRYAGYLPMSDQILNATLVVAPKQRNINAKKADIQEGRIPKKWQDDGTIPLMDLAILFFGYKSHISINRKFRLIRKWKATDAEASDGVRLREGLLDRLENQGINKKRKKSFCFLPFLSIARIWLIKFVFYIAITLSRFNTPYSTIHILTIFI